MSVITCFHLAARGYPVHGGPSSILTSLLTSLSGGLKKKDWWGGKAVTSFRTGPNKGPGACGVVFISLVIKSSRKVVLGCWTQVKYRWSPWHDLLGSDECVWDERLKKRHSHSSYDNFNETGKEIFLHQDHGCLNWLNFDGKLKVMAVNGAAEISDPLGVI